MISSASRALSLLAAQITTSARHRFSHLRWTGLGSSVTSPRKGNRDINNPPVPSRWQGFRSQGLTEGQKVGLLRQFPGNGLVVDPTQRHTSWSPSDDTNKTHAPVARGRPTDGPSVVSTFVNARCGLDHMGMPVRPHGTGPMRENLVLSTPFRGPQSRPPKRFIKGLSSAIR